MSYRLQDASESAMAADQASSFIGSDTIIDSIARIALQIQQLTDAKVILQQAIDHLRDVLRVDLVVVYQYLPTGAAIAAFESSAEDALSVLGQRLEGLTLPSLWSEPDRRGDLALVTENLIVYAPCGLHDDEYCRCQANLEVPLFNQNRVWGVLTVHQCGSPREWQVLERQLLQQVAQQLGLAIQLRFCNESEDIAERQQQNDLLRRYERMIASLPDGVSLIDRNYIYQFINQTYLTWHQKSCREIVGHSVSELLGHEFFESVCKPFLDRCLAGELNHTVESWINYPDGKRRFVRASYVPYVAQDNQISGVVVNVHDLTDLKLVEEALVQSEERLRQMATGIDAVFWMTDLDCTQMIYVSPAYEKIWRRSCASLYEQPQSFLEVIHPADRAAVLAVIEGQRHMGFSHEYRLLHPNETICWIWERAFPVLDSTGKPYRLTGVSQDITERKMAEFILSQQAERQRLLTEIAQHIRQTLDLNEILGTTVTEVQHFLQTDRVIIYRFELDWSGLVIAESVAPGWSSILYRTITDSYFVQTQGRDYYPGTVKAIGDVARMDLSPCYRRLLEQMQVRAKLVVPIWQDNQLWGLLVAHHCRSSRQWQSLEIELLQQLATQLEIAIQQSELHHQVQRLNMTLERQVKLRTAQLELAFEFEATLKRITDKVRDSLDEAQIMQAVVRELAQALKVSCCNASIYNLEQKTAMIRYEYSTLNCSYKGRVIQMADYPELYNQLLGGEAFQCCSMLPNPDRGDVMMLAYPISDNQGVLGDLWLVNQKYYAFHEQDLRLVQQVANQCAIALRQSRLYQAAQAQVQELERLNRLKDDFLSTVSHELRSPMSSIKMATQMLEISLQPLGVLADRTHPINRYFKILREEEQREINLINDLLDLARLDSESSPLDYVAIDLPSLVHRLVEPFHERASNQQQHLEIHIPECLPLFTTDLSYLERILTELIHNACKYTPAGERITVSAQTGRTHFEICVSNSGVEIPPSEYDRIFEKFYRMPKNDPWKHGGTGLGLALVKKLVERLGGSIRVESWAGQTSFILKFAAAP